MWCTRGIVPAWVPRANWNVVCRLTRGMSQGECHVACCMAYYMATATWHDAWRLPRGMTYGECLMVQPSSCSAAVRFWRGLVAQFPQLIDYLCTDADLGQVRAGPAPHSLSPGCSMCVCACACEHTHTHTYTHTHTHTHTNKHTHTHTHTHTWLQTASRQSAEAVHRPRVNPDGCVRAAAHVPLRMHL